MRRKQTLSLWGFIIAALILVFFSVQNAKEVGFKFFIWKTYLPLSVLLIVAFSIGLIVGAIFLFRNNRAPKTMEKTDKHPSTPKDQKDTEQSQQDPINKTKRDDSTTH